MTSNLWSSQVWQIFSQSNVTNREKLVIISVVVNLYILLLNVTNYELVASLDSLLAYSLCTEVNF